jgi:hypothetical protein
MQASLATLGEVLLESKIVEKMLRSVPPRFKQIVVTIRTLLDTSTLSVADLTGRLKAAEESFEGPPSLLLHDGKLHLTEEEWNSRRKRGRELYAPGRQAWTRKRPRRRFRIVFVYWTGQLYGQGGQGSMSPVWQNRPLGPGLSTEAQKGGGPRRPG